MRVLEAQRQRAIVDAADKSCGRHAGFKGTVRDFMDEFEKHLKIERLG